MPNVLKVIAPGEGYSRIVDTLILDCQQRRMPRGVVTGEKGTCVGFDNFVSPFVLRTDDVLLLDSGDAVEIVSAPEMLLEVRGDIATLSRIAHALGDRHMPAQILGNRIRLHRAEGAAALARSLGGKVAEIEAPFEPEGGAYAVRVAHGHHHPHDAGDDHSHCDGDHSHGHGRMP